MKILNTTSRLLGGGALALALATAPQVAFAVASGGDVINNVSVVYDVGGTTQPTINVSNTFKIDKKVDVDVTNMTGASVSVDPDQTGVRAVFRVTNQGNDAQDIAVLATQLGTDNYNLEVLKLYQDTDTVWGGGVDITASPTLSNIAAGGITYVWVVGDVPVSQADGSKATIYLRGTVHAVGGAAEVATGDGVADTEGAVDVVFADAAGVDSDAARDGYHSATVDFDVAAATINVTKSSLAIDDGLITYVDGVSYPKHIPGAIVEYTIAIANSGSVTATNITVTDTLPAGVTFQADVYSTTKEIRVVADALGTPSTTDKTGDVGDADVDGASFDGTDTVVANGLSVPAGQTLHVKFQVQIDL